MTKHTPGPWSYEPETGEIFFDDMGGAEVFPLVATVSIENADDEAQAHADGRLIAAAPEMLVEIRKQVGWLRHIRPQLTGKVAGSVVMGVDQSIKYLSAIISKIEG